MVMDKELRGFKLGIPRIFKSSYASCRSRIFGPQPPPTTNSSSFRKPRERTVGGSSKRLNFNPHHALFGASASPVSCLILDREFYYQNPRSKQSNEKKKSRTSSKRRRRVEVGSSSSSDDDEEEDVFFSSRSRWSGEHEMKESVVAVVKSSRDPYEDFRTSMVEMIVVKRILSGKDLEKLLQSFLALNSRHHHRVILQVFMEIWDALFSDCP